MLPLLRFLLLSSFVNVLKEYKQLGDLKSSSTLRMAVEKLPPILKEKWWFYVDDKDKDWPDLIMFEKWLGRMAFVHEGFSSFKDEKGKDDRRNFNKDRKFSKGSNFSASTGGKESNSGNQCPLEDGRSEVFQRIKLQRKHWWERKQFRQSVSFRRWSSQNLELPSVQKHERIRKICNSKETKTLLRMSQKGMF